MDRRTALCLRLHHAIRRAQQRNAFIARAYGTPLTLVESHLLVELDADAGRSGAGAEYLVPPACRDGGTLDLDPGSSRFP